MKTLTGKTRYAFIAFFASHIPITLIIDSQAAFPGLHPQIFQDLLDWYTNTFNDSLMRAPFDTWFRAVVFGEILFQLPFFFYAVYGLLNPRKVDGKGVFRSFCMIYGAHTSTTLLPILVCLAVNPEATLLEKGLVVSMYLPYLIFPLWLVVICTLSENVFGSTSQEGKKTK
mmetsp:Transcript_14051/g.17078  ORF Transcript_14051/g.17078 Transcript_14051/m.17078 type:complete len:171 (+) Transcript_14051:116-628(+)